MGFLKLATLGALGYGAYSYLQKRKDSDRAAFAPSQSDSANFAQVRDAGPNAMRDRSKRKWSKTDEASDESFPASDPPGNY
jgi:uncharacterized membrane protein YebE (DUF533 family)